MAAGGTGAFVDDDTLLEAGETYHVRVDPDDPSSTDPIRGWLLEEADDAVAVTITEGDGRLIYAGEVHEVVVASGFRRLSFIGDSTYFAAVHVYVNKVS